MCSLAAGEILEALEGAAQDLGGSMHRLGDRRAVLTMPVGGGRSMKLQAHLFEVLAGIHVCQIAKDAGSSMDFMRCYGQLAARLQPIMMKRNAFPTATRAAALLSTTSSMGDSERQAIDDLPPASPSDISEAGMGSGVSLMSQRPAEAGLWGQGFSGRSTSRASLISVPEEPEPAEHSLHAEQFARSSGDTRSSGSTPAGGSPLAGGSPKAWQPLPPLEESSPGKAAQQATPGNGSMEGRAANGSSRRSS